ncbi:MAG: Gfo/Idh/MocA family oxidoreductase [Armatimonadetes bacterium]|nr:Gfo/Idh/MocA family oxidoreductase [Armatimonadota bacterium]
MIRVGMISAAHVHAPSYAHALGGRTDATWAGLYDEDEGRAEAFAARWGGTVFPDVDSLLASSDAIVVCSPNMQHADHIGQAARAGKPILCEKPLAPNRQHAQEIADVLKSTGVLLMTAFPCPFSPAFQQLQARIGRGEIGKVLAVNATNRGRCPFGWFVEPHLSGGGAMVDHAVHVADLLRRLLGEDPTRVFAQTGHNMYGKPWEDTAHLNLAFDSGVFATLDSSWSRPQNYRIWGDVTLKVTGEKGVIEIDLFDQGLSVLTDGYHHRGTGSNLDRLMMDEFLAAVRESRQPAVTAHDGLMASRVAIAGYESLVSGAYAAV